MRIFFIIFLLLGSLVGINAQLTINQLLVESRSNPIGIDTPHPRFTWILHSLERNKLQTAYQIRVTLTGNNTQEDKKILWDSGKVFSAQSTFVKYAGKALQSGQRYDWQVRVWDERGKVSEWSAFAFWQMGLLEPSKEFKAKWIRPYFDETKETISPIFKKDFQLKKKVKRATAYITAHGMYEAIINGQRLGDAYLTPGWTSYNKRLQYQVYDITDQLQIGSNEILATLGNGWYRGVLAWANHRNLYGSDLALLMQIELNYADGTKEFIPTDKSWQSAKSEILFSELYDGEIIDTRISSSNSKWEKVITANYPKDYLIATYNEPIRQQEIIEPLRIFQSPKGEWIIDFGQNLVGWVSIKTKGKKGDTLQVYHAEVLDQDGNFYTDNLRAAQQKMTYILDGQDQILHPYFTFQGFRYAKIEGWQDSLKAEDFKAIALYSDMALTGSFNCSDTLLNQLQSNIEWSQKGNFLDVPTDCPQRDERMGWTGDAQVFFRTAAYNRHVYNFFSKWLKDLAADQKEDGRVPFVVPQVMGTNAYASAGWADAATIIPWQMYEEYGDTSILKEQYQSMKAWVDYMRSQSEQYLWNTGFHFGDWLFYSIDDDRQGKSAITDKSYIAQCFFAHSTHILAKAAQVLGYSEEAYFYQEEYQKIKKAFQYEYLSPSGRLTSNSQTAYVLALQFDLLPKHLRKQAAQRLVDNIKSYDYHLTTGFLGTPHLCHVLSRFGHADIAFELLQQSSYPSWLYPITKGATTIWERWDGIQADGSFQTPKMNSFNHYAYGAIGDWMYQHLAGISRLDSTIGYQNIKIRPSIGGGINSAKGSLITYYGTIRSEWKIENEQFVLQVEIPVNTKAEIYIPSSDLSEVTEGETPIEHSRDIQILETTTTYTKLSLGSGKFQFKCPYPTPTILEMLQDFSGSYESTRSFGPEIEIKVDNENVFLHFHQEPILLKEIEADYYHFHENSEKTVRFTRTRTGRIFSIVIQLAPGRIVAKKK